ncbi:MAG: Bug family tripartite tricarboxylate transporter substrate binding protein [Casimicrobium sp.]
MKRFLQSLCIMALATTSSFGFAAYPDKPVRVVVPSAAGGSPDALTRYLVGELAKSLGQAFVVDNKPGAAGQIAMRDLASAAPDGYTIAYANVVTHAINKGLLPTLSYDPEKDTTPIALIAFTQNALVVNPSVAAKNVGELVALAKQQPGKLSMASAGNGTTGHLSGEMFKAATGTQIVHAPYRGSPQAINDLIGGQVQLMFDNLASIGPHIQGGRVRALAVTGNKRSPLFPELPTMEEAGVKNVVATAWGGFVAPAKTPNAIINRLNVELNKILARDDVKARLVSMGFEPFIGTPADFAKHSRSETAMWAEVIKRSGAKAD